MLKSPVSKTMSWTLMQATGKIADDQGLQDVSIGQILDVFEVEMKNGWDLRISVEDESVTVSW